MTEQPTQTNWAPSQQDKPRAWATGFVMFAGLVALFENEFYVSTRNYLLQFDATSWGWIHLLLGLAVLFASFAVLSGQSWGRVVGIILAVLNAFANFAFMSTTRSGPWQSSPSTFHHLHALTAHKRDITR